MRHVSEEPEQREQPAIVPERVTTTVNHILSDIVSPAYGVAVFQYEKREPAAKKPAARKTTAKKSTAVKRTETAKAEAKKTTTRKSTASEKTEPIKVKTTSKRK